MVIRMKDNNVFIFSGQNSFYSGIGENLFSNNKLVKTIYEEAEDISGLPLRKLSSKTCLDLEKQKKYIQLLIVTYQIAMYSLIKRYLDDDSGMFAGHSLGEYSALVCANKISFPQMIKLIKKRSEIMFNELSEKNTIMVAVSVNNTNEFYNRVNMAKGIYIACFNTQHQCVIGGKNIKVMDFLQQNNIKNLYNKYSVLNVLGAFHTPIVKKVADNLFENYLNLSINKEQKNTVFSCYQGDIHLSHEIGMNLYFQNYMPVEWENILENILEFQGLSIYEIGPKAIAGKLQYSQNISRYLLFSEDNLIGDKYGIFKT